MKKFGKVLSLVFAIAGTAGVAAHLNHAVGPAKVLASTAQLQPLKPPADGKINVAFVISDGADVMDIVGPWEVFNDTMLTSSGKPWHGSDGDDMVMPFNTYTVSDSQQPTNAGGLTVIPNYTFDKAPKPQVIVIPAQGGRTPAQKAWLLANSAEADITMSVCTGASMLAGYGMLAGQTATTHHLFWGQMQKQYPAVHFLSGTRFVDHGKIATAGGVTSGIDLALHVVERYYGREVAESAADFTEYRSELWKNPDYDQVRAVAAAK
jgi:transcriptional regulator GlxA family with amidase domain